MIYTKNLNPDDIVRFYSDDIRSEWYQRSE